MDVSKEQSLPATERAFTRNFSLDSKSCVKEVEIMGFWVFMLIMELLIPVIMIVFGSIFVKRAPKEINSVYGYRTTMSMKNKDTWEFAHHYCGKVWRDIGWILLPLSFVAMLFVRGKGEDAAAIAGLILLVVQTVIIVVSIAPTERALRETFDENGNRKK